MELANLVKSNLKKENSRVFQFSSVHFSRSVESDSFRPRESQHTTWELLLWEFHVKIYSDWHGLGYMPIPEQTDADMLLLSRFSRVRLCATPKTAAHQASPSLGFSWQEHWSGLPYPSPMHESEKGSHSVVSDS